MSGQPAIRMHGVARAFAEGDRQHVVFGDLCLEIPTSQSVALMGRSGAGKSTLLNLVAGIDTPDRGEIEIFGHPLHRLDDRGRTLLRRREVGFVFQFFNLLPALSVLDNVALPLQLLGQRAGEARRRAAAMLDRVGLAARAHSQADRLSGGEQQRVAIARALVHEPRLILADEPTGNLDASTADDILALLAELACVPGRVLLMATHSDEAAAICSRGVRIDELDRSAA